MIDILSYSFITRGIIAGLIIGGIAPFIGTFLIVRRYSLLADTLSHVSLAGIAIGLLFHINPLLSALIASVVGSVSIEKIRGLKRSSGDSALALFLSGSLALATVLMGLQRGARIDITSYLFGSILTVQSIDLVIMTVIGVIVATLLVLFFEQLVYTSFDPDSAQVSGIHTKRINTMLVVLAALTIAAAIPIVGVLLVSALMVIPVLAASKLKRSFVQTLMVSEVISILSVIAGILISFTLNISTGGTIVLCAIGAFLVTSTLGKIYKKA